MSDSIITIAIAKLKRLAWPKSVVASALASPVFFPATSAAVRINSRA